MSKRLSSIVSIVFAVGLALLFLGCAQLPQLPYISPSTAPSAVPSVAPSIPPLPSETPVACTMDARICPDGSAVGRVPPDCEFAPCPSMKPSPAPVGCVFDSATNSCCEGDLCQSTHVTCVEGTKPVYGGCDENCGVIVDCIQINASPTECVAHPNAGACCKGDSCNLQKVSCIEGSVPRFKGCDENCTALAECVPAAFPSPS